MNCGSRRPERIADRQRGRGRSVRWRLRRLFDLQDRIRCTSRQPRAAGSRSRARSCAAQASGKHDRLRLALQALDVLSYGPRLINRRAVCSSSPSGTIPTTRRPTPARRSGIPSGVGQGGGRPTQTPTRPLRSRRRRSSSHHHADALAIYGHARSFLMKDYVAGATYLDRATTAGPSSALAWTLSSCTSA